MNYHYKANKVSLHVRKSNRGAIRLYEELLGYKVAGVASSYYSDGEDAFVMEAQLPEVDSQVIVVVVCVTVQQHLVWVLCALYWSCQHFVYFKFFVVVFRGRVSLPRETYSGDLSHSEY